MCIYGDKRATLKKKGHIFIMSWYIERERAIVQVKVVRLIQSSRAQIWNDAMTQDSSQD